MKIHILTSCFYPELHPRAFRAFELARELARQGDAVQVSVLTRVQDFDYKAKEEKYGFQIQILDLYQRQPGQTEQTGLSLTSTKKWKQKLFSAHRFLVEYLLAGNLLRYAPRIAQQLIIEPDTDLFIALSTPFMDILAGALYRRKHILPNTRFIADSGDPFSGSQQTPRAVYLHWLEKWVYKYYDYLTLPMEAAIPAYMKVIETDKIHIIPQGFNFAATPIATYKKNAWRFLSRHPQSGVLIGISSERKQTIPIPYLSAAQGSIYRCYTQHISRRIRESFGDSVWRRTQTTYL